jgi:dihydrofolate reductase
MRKITAGLFISLDSVVEAPDQWHFPYFNEEMGAAVDATLGAADTVLFGRKTYDSFAGAWPEREAAGGEDAGFAKALGDARKIVVSSQPLEFAWRNSEQLEGDLVEAVTALKNEPGGNIALSGSVSVVRQLLAAGLLDELHLLVHPIAVRKGMRLFDEGETPIPLRLISSETFKTGVLNLVYGPAESIGDATYEAPRSTWPSQSSRAGAFSRRPWPYACGGFLGQGWVGWLARVNATAMAGMRAVHMDFA